MPGYKDGREADTIIGDTDPWPGRRAVEAHPHPTGVTVPGDVGQGLLGDADQHPVVRRGGRGVVGIQFGDDAVHPSPTPDDLVQGIGQGIVIQLAWRQGLHRPPGLREAVPRHLFGSPDLS